MICRRVKRCDYCPKIIHEDERSVEIKTYNPGSINHKNIHHMCANCMRVHGVKDL